jgi:hypothetical protein
MIIGVARVSHPFKGCQGRRKALSLVELNIIKHLTLQIVRDKKD